MRQDIGYVPLVLIIASEDVRTKKAEALSRFFKAILQAEDFATHNLEDVRTLVSAATELDKQMLERLWTSYDLRIQLNTPETINVLNDDAAYVQRDDPNFKDKPIPDYRTFIDPNFLTAVAPERVNLD